MTINNVNSSFPTNFPELIRLVRQILPQASFGVDNYGQVVVYTNLSEIGVEGELVEFSGDEEVTVED